LEIGNMLDPKLDIAIASVPAGRWAVGVSGGADSVALLSLLRSRADLSLHVVHLDHQTRADESAADARFVADLASRWNLPCTIARRDEIEPLLRNPPSNPSARYRALRLTLFRKVAAKQNLTGVILAHHAEDQAETVLHRLLRNSAYGGLVGMQPQATLGSLLILRPLLHTRRQSLRNYLTQNHLAWREDASNESAKYLRNRLRKLLATEPRLIDDLLVLSEACGRLRQWTRSVAPTLDEEIRVEELAKLPKILADESIRNWLIARGVPPPKVESSVIERLLAMAADAATPPKQEFPGKRSVRRRGGIIFVDSSPAE
jgi:tRNA(Ile)-lysidine synthetase-like protein